MRAACSWALPSALACQHGVSVGRPRIPASPNAAAAGPLLAPWFLPTSRTFSLPDCRFPDYTLGFARVPMMAQQPAAALYPVPLTLEGSAVLHQMLRVRWSEWRKLDAISRSQIVQEAGAALSAAEAAGQSALYSLLG